MPTWTKEIFVKTWGVDPKLSCLVHTSHTGLGRDKPWHVQMSNRTFPAVKTLFFFSSSFFVETCFGPDKCHNVRKVHSASMEPQWWWYSSEKHWKRCANYAQINLAKQICCSRKYRQKPSLIPVIILGTIGHWKRTGTKETLCAYFFTVEYNKKTALKTNCVSCWSWAEKRREKFDFLWEKFWRNDWSASWVIPTQLTAFLLHWCPFRKETRSGKYKKFFIHCWKRKCSSARFSQNIYQKYDGPAKEYPSNRSIFNNI